MCRFTVQPRREFGAGCASLLLSVLIAGTAAGQTISESQGRRQVPPPVPPPGAAVAGATDMHGAQSDAHGVPSIEQFMRIRVAGQPHLAADGTLYVRDWPDGVNQLYRRAAGRPIDAEFERLTHFEDGLSSYAVSPDGRRIVLAASAGGSEQDDLHLMDARTGHITTLFSHPRIVYGFNLWLDDSSGFIFTANEESRTDFHIYHYDIASGERRKLLSREGFWVASDITRDARRMLVNRYYSASHAEVHELDLESGELTAHLLTRRDAYHWGAGYLPDERSVAIICDREDGVRRLFVRDLADGRVRKPISALDPFEVEGWAVNRERTHAVVTVNDGGYAEAFVYALPDFSAVPLPERDRGLMGDAQLQGRTLVYTLNNAQSPGVTYRIDLDSRGAPEPLTVADTQGIDLSAFPLPELITYPSFDGLEIPAFLYLPPGAHPGQPIPFVAHFHGGPESQFRPRFTALIQYLLANGYGVIQPNVRGSTGYGREFHMMDNYRKRWDSVRDGVEAARWLVKNGYAQQGRIAAYGGSYGGFMAVATVIEDPEVFGASIKVVGIVNFITFLEQTGEYRRALREAEYGPLSDPEFLASISPINRIDEIRVPLFIAHGLNDPRVPVGEAMQLAVGLQRRGHDPEQLYFPDEGHGFAKLDNRLLFAERMVRFLNRTIQTGR